MAELVGPLGDGGVTACGRPTPLESPSPAFELSPLTVLLVPWHLSYWGVKEDEDAGVAADEPVVPVALPVVERVALL